MKCLWKVNCGYTSFNNALVGQFVDVYHLTMPYEGTLLVYVITQCLKMYAADEYHLTMPMTDKLLMYIYIGNLSSNDIF